MTPGTKDSSPEMGNKLTPKVSTPINPTGPLSDHDWDQTYPTDNLDTDRVKISLLLHDYNLELVEKLA